MIQCIPRGVCSWSFQLTGSGHRGSTEHRWAGEQGSLVVDGVQYEVWKDGAFSGGWRLRGAGGTVAVAKKPSAFRRQFEIEHDDQHWSLEATGLGRTMRLRGPAGRAMIEPEHAFTRRAVIRGETGDFVVTCFAFWLTVLIWRRSANSAAAANSAH